VTVLEGAEEREPFMKPHPRQNMKKEGHPYFASARIGRTGIIAPETPRMVLGLGACL